MALQKISRSLLNTGVADSSDATAITIDSSENVTLAGTLTSGAVVVTGDANPALEVSRGSANTTNVNLKYNTTLTGQLSAANAKFQISAVGSSTPMEFYTNGARRLIIDSAGFFDYESTGNDIARFSGPNSGGLTIRNDIDNQVILHTATSDALVFGTGGNNDRMTIDASGNVGIGATSPGYPLEISSTATVSLAYQRTGFSCKKWGFNSDNSFTYWMNLTDNVLALSLSNAGLLSTAGGLATTQTTALALDLNGTHSGGNYIAWKKAGAAQFYIGSSNTVGAGSGYYDLYAISGYGLRFFTGAAQRWSINTSGHFTPNNQHAYDIGGTNAEVRNVYAQGISFASNANASGMTSELLDDYEEGTWTPVLNDSGAAITNTGGTTYNWYVKVGKVVHLSANIVFSAADNSGNAIRISGLPFNTGSATAVAGSMISRYAGSVGTIAPYLTGNNIYFYLQSSGSNWRIIAYNDVGQYEMHLSITYQTT